MKRIKLILAIGLITLLGSCVSPGGAGGILFNIYSGPFQATSNAAGGKTGTSSVYCFIGLVCIGDASIAAASQEAGIKKIASVDYKYLSVLSIVFNSTTIIVTGE